MLETGRSNDLVDPAIQRRQALVHAAISLVGGYWRPLAGAVRVLEEIGELSECLFATSSQPIREALVCEIADLWIITTAIGNQFRILLNSAPASNAAAATALVDEDIIRELLRQAGHLARAINYYDGPKTPRSFEGWVPLRCSIPALHRALYQLAAHHDLNLDAAIDYKLGEIPKRDGGRFAASYDPITSPSLAAFDEVRRITRCP